MNRLRLLFAIFLVGIITLGSFSCSKETLSENKEVSVSNSSFTPQCDFSKKIDTTLHFKIAMMAKIISTDSTFNSKILQFSILPNPSEADFYSILNFQGLNLTNEEATFLNSLNSVEAESFYKEVETQFGCLNQMSLSNLALRASLWRTLWRVGSSAVAIGVGCATGPGCILAGMYAVDQLSSVYCDFYPRHC